MMEEFAAKRVRIFVVWEPVLFTDWFSPSTSTLDRISNPAAAQFWDKGRVISHSMGEHDGRHVVWDYVAVYPAGASWEDRPPQPLYSGGPVVRVLNQTRAALSQALGNGQGLSIGIQSHGAARNAIDARSKYRLAMLGLERQFNEESNCATAKGSSFPFRTEAPPTHWRRVALGHEVKQEDAGSCRRTSNGDFCDPRRC